MLIHVTTRALNLIPRVRFIFHHESIVLGLLLSIMLTKNVTPNVHLAISHVGDEIQGKDRCATCRTAHCNVKLLVDWTVSLCMTPAV